LAIPKVILIIESSREYGRGLLRGIANYASQYGPWSFYRDEDLFYRKPDKRKMLPLLKKWGADGIIMREREESQDIIQLGIPTIIAPYTYETFADTPKIAVNCRAVGRMGADHLFNRGFRHFAFCGFNDMPWSVERGVGFKQQLTKYNMKTHMYTLPKPDKSYRWEEEQLFMKEWLMQLPKPIGVLACNDDRSRHLLEACKSANRRVPQDVAILGVGNDEMICKLSQPQLSSISRNHEHAGFEAAKLLDEMMSGKMTKHASITVQPTHVVTRQSTSFFAINDADLLKAVRFINKHCNEAIQVDDVVSATSLSRRKLELAFKKELNRSILKEMRRIRTDKIAQMLIETNLSITQIALAFGFSSPSHIGRYFKQEKGLTTQEYRQKNGTKNV
jgi:LacI family transcriptional regulator